MADGLRISFTREREREREREMSSSLSHGSIHLPKPREDRLAEISRPKTNPNPIVVRGQPPTFVSAPGRRIIAVGDLHGDLRKARCALEMAGVLSSDGRDSWVGGDSVLVQLGDILDRGEDEIAILSLLQSLNTQAEQTGGAVFQVNGNHETMNVNGDYRYVDGRAFDECLDFLDYLSDHEDNWEKAFLGWSRVSENWKENRRSKSKGLWGPWRLIQKQKGASARSFLLRPGGPLACELAQHPVILKVGDWIFCHGGLLPKHVAYGIERMNMEVSNWMLGHDGDKDHEIPFFATKGYDSVVWNRLYSRDCLDLSSKSWQVCSVLEETLQALGAKAMVVGHTPQIYGINSICDRKIWRIDVGMSSGVLDSIPEVLEIVDNNARALRTQSDDFFDDPEVSDYT